jgi:hypothetical protein
LEAFDRCLNANHITADNIQSATFINENNDSYSVVSSQFDDNKRPLTMAVVEYNVKKVCEESVA